MKKDSLSNWREAVEYITAIELAVDEAVKTGQDPFLAGMKVKQKFEEEKDNEPRNI